MPVLIAPDVYIREFDFSNFVQPSSSAVAAFVLTSQTGPYMERTFISNAMQALETFGKTSTSSKGMYGLLQFLRRGNQAWVVRVGNTDNLEYPSVDVPGKAYKATVTNSTASPYVITAATTATMTGTEVGPFTIVAGDSDQFQLSVVTDGGAPVTYGPVTLTDGVRTAQEVCDDLNAGGSGLTFSVSAGKIKIDHNTASADSTFTISAVADDAYTVLGFTATDSASGSDGEDTLDIAIDNGSGATTYNVVLTAGTRTAAQVVADINAEIGVNGLAEVITTNSGKFVRVSSASGGASTSVRILSTSNADTVLGFDNTLHSGSAAGATTLTFKERYYGDTDVKVVLSNGTNYTNTNKVYKVKVYQAGVLVSQYDDVRKTASTPAEELQLFEAVIGTSANPVDPFIVVDDGPGTGEPDITDTVNGDTFELDPLGADPSGYDISVNGDEIVDGLQLFADTSAIEIDLLLAPGQSHDAVVTEMITIAEVRRDCVALIDPPYGLTSQQVVDWHNGVSPYDGHSSLSSSYAATAYPWVQVYDAINDENVWTAPSGHFAAIVAFSDSVSAPWRAPAGLTRGKIIPALKLERKLTDGERTLLLGTSNRVNTFVDFHVDGPTLFSQVTLHRQDSKIAKISTRRMLLVAQRAIKKAVRSLNFEPNNFRTWGRFEALVNPFLQGIANDNGLEEFKVVANSITTPSSLRDRDEMRGIIYMKPSSTAEKILVDFVLTSQGASFASLDTLLF